MVSQARSNEVADVGVVHAQHAHLGAAAIAGRLDGLAGAVEHAHERDRPGGLGVDRLDQRALGPDGAEIIADAAALLECKHGLAQRLGDAIHAVGDRLDEAVDQCNLQARAGAGLDAPAGNEAIVERLGEALLPVFLMVGLDRGEGARHARSLRRAVFPLLGVFLVERVVGDRLEFHGVGHPVFVEDLMDDRRGPPRGGPGRRGCRGRPDSTALKPRPGGARRRRACPLTKT